jgi:uncharacterized membrane protein
MLEWLVNLSLPKELITLLIAILPVAELRGALPIALGVFELPFYSAFILSWLGSILPGIFWVYALGFVSNELRRRFKFFNRFFEWLFARTHRRFWRHHERLGSLALVLFVAIPLPITGVWTGSVAAFLFKIPKKTAVALIALGSFIAGVIVSLIYYGALSFFRFLI